MDFTDWSALPEELLQSVLACLPLACAARLRCVCKKWSSILGSRELESVRTLVAPARKPWFVFLASGRGYWQKDWWCAAYDPSDRKWRRLALKLDSRNDFSLFLTSVGSTLCVATHLKSKNCSELWMCNPFTGTKMSIPSPPSRFCLGPPDLFQTPSAGNLPEFFQAMIINHVTGNFKLVVQGYYKTIEEYNSVTKSWTIIRTNPPSHIQFSVAHPICGEILYCLAKNPTRVVAYDVNYHRWNDSVVLVDASVHRPHLVKYQDELLLVGAVKRTEGMEIGTISRTCVWKLNLLERKWEEMVAMPVAIQEKFLERHDCSSLYFVGQGDVLYFTSMPKSSMKTVTEPLVYDFTCRTWYWTPKCSFTVRQLFMRRLVAPVWRSYYNMPNIFASEASLVDVFLPQ
ncbi:hypothetical protein O6H91_Y389300 [Diphasiastrum complanatum]|nr:hypothetical protein O6H91_Y389300 [Diphasiastrum complanatum]KAJ7277582.1 hypothetical protein O6H91_Y389300 [Diphasiastrum complanatum]KAJ7277583.1 hypothetical protein O6H91_Y389300 [Diphasiastrum complanatum]